MEAAIQYFLQFSIAITLFYGLYLLILKNETFYNANRFYLVSGLLLAIFLPLFPITYTTPISLVNNADFFSLSEKQLSDNVSIANVDATVNSWTYIDFLITIYVSGTMLFLARLLWQTMKVFQKIKKSNYKIIDGIKVIHQPDVMPFSFFNVVFIDIQKYSERELSNIIAHEKVHIRERHWIDLLIIELLSVLFWINPVVWLYERSIKQNHEYLADQGVLLAGYHPGQYQALLINQLMGIKVLGFAHNLNFSLNKKRMKMMKKEESPRASKMKLLLALPIIALLVFAFAKEEYVMGEPKNPSIDVQSEIDEGINTNDLITVKGKVTDSEGNPMTGSNVIFKGTNNGTVVDRKGEFIMKTPRKFTLVVSYVGYETVQETFNSEGKESIEVSMNLKKGVFNIQLPDANDPNIKMQLPPPPPPKDSKAQGKEIFTVVEQMPYYQNGGMSRLALDIKKEVDWVLEKTKDRGEAVVGFTVSANGKIVNPHITKSANSKMLDASAVRIMAKLDNWWAGIQRGKRVPVDLTVPVNFN